MIVFYLLLVIPLMPIAYYGIYNIAYLNIAAAALGWGITAIMVSYVAPFWYELLNKLVNQRVTGPKPKVAPDAKPT